MQHSTLALIAVAALAVAACGPPEPAPVAAPASADLPAGHPPIGDTAVAGGAAPHAAVAPIDVCGTFPLASVEAALGKINKSKPLFAAGQGGPSPFAGGCQFIAAKMKSARVEIGNAESLSSAGHPDAKAYVTGVAAASLPKAQPLAGLGDAALIQDEGTVVLIVASQGGRLVQVVSGDIGRDATVAIARAALQ